MAPNFLVIGAGVAGMRAAIELAPAGRVLVIAKEGLHDSASEYAQGGIAAALADDDEIELHESDTLYAGDGLCERAAVHALVNDGPAAIQELIGWGAEFDREGGGLAFAREGAHSRNRVLHAHGDSTGREIARVLYRKAASLGNVEFRSYAAVEDLLVDGDAVCGALVRGRGSSEQTAIVAPAVLLATGGLGQVFGQTTNPAVATGDGVAMAYRAGAEIADIEFVQFHPTALALKGAPRFLLSEALRGEGATLKNAAGERFMARYHEMGDLAPRDVVARAIVAEGKRTGAPVYLDITAKGADFARDRFPRIYATCLEFGIDLGREAAPVAPAAHYAMGGVKTDLDGRTNLTGLFAAGEAASTGVHGANRLASNSLLEGVVFGARAGRAMRESSMSAARAGREPETTGPAPDAAQVQRVAWEKCGILRDGERLADACAWLEREGPGAGGDGAARNMRDVALLIARTALARKESRGAHYRTDYPEKSAAFARHSIVRRGRAVEFREGGVE